MGCLIHVSAVFARPWANPSRARDDYQRARTLRRRTARLPRRMVVHSDDVEPGRIDGDAAARDAPAPGRRGRRGARRAEPLPDRRRRARDAGPRARRRGGALLRPRGEGLSWQDGRAYAVRAGDCVLHRPRRRGAHASSARGDGLDVLAFGGGSDTGLTWLPRARAWWNGPHWLPHDGPRPVRRRGAAGPLEVPDARARGARRRSSRSPTSPAERLHRRGRRRRRTPRARRRARLDAHRRAATSSSRRARSAARRTATPPRRSCSSCSTATGRCCSATRSTRCARAASSRARPAPACAHAFRAGDGAADAAGLRHARARRHRLLPALGQGRAARDQGALPRRRRSSTGTVRRDARALGRRRARASATSATCARRSARWAARRARARSACRASTSSPAAAPGRCTSTPPRRRSSSCSTGSGLAWIDGAVHEIGAGDTIVYLAGGPAHTRDRGRRRPRPCSPTARTTRRRSCTCRAPGMVRRGGLWLEASHDDPLEREAAAGPLELPAPTPRPPCSVALEDVELDDRRDGRVRHRPSATSRAPPGSVRSGLRHDVVAARQAELPAALARGRARALRRPRGRRRRCELYDNHGDARRGARAAPGPLRLAPGRHAPSPTCCARATRA